MSESKELFLRESKKKKKAKSDPKAKAKSDPKAKAKSDPKAKAKSDPKAKAKAKAKPKPKPREKKSDQDKRLRRIKKEKAALAVLREHQGGENRLHDNPTNNEIKNAYRKLAFKYHTDRNAAGGEAMKKITAAYEILFPKPKPEAAPEDGVLAQQ